MSTLSLRKIKHDSSSVDNITLGSTGQTGFNTSTPSSQVGIKSSGANGLVLETDSADSTCSTRIFAKNDTYTGGVYFDNTGWNITTGSTIGSASGLSRLNITRDGYVRTPYQPAFHAYISNGGGGFTYTQNTPVQLAATVFNRGSCYNTSTYRFTAPISGIYQFNGKINFTNPASGQGTRSAQIAFKINGTATSEWGIVRNAMYVGYSGGYPGIAGSVAFNLNTNDYVEMAVQWETDGGSFYSGQTISLFAHSTSFSGYLVG